MGCSQWWDSRWWLNTHMANMGSNWRWVKDIKGMARYKCDFTFSTGSHPYNRCEATNLRLLHMTAVSFISQVMPAYVYNMDKAVRRLEGTEWGESLDRMDHWTSLDFRGWSGKEVVFNFPPMELQPKIFQHHNAGFPSAERKPAKRWYLTGFMHRYAQHAVIRRYRMEQLVVGHFSNCLSFFRPLPAPQKVL